MNKKRVLTLEIIGTVGFFIFWQLVSSLKVINELYISSPYSIAKYLAEMFLTGDIFPHLLISLEAFCLGLFLAVFFGVLLGIIFGWEVRMFSFFRPLLYSLYATPYVALLPLLVIWLGLGIWTKVAVVFLGGFFPIIVSTITGVQTVDSDYLKLSKSFGGTSLDTIRRIVFPASVPLIAAGLKQGIPRAVVGLVAAEFFASNAGLGFLIATYGTTFDTGKILAIVIILIVISFALTNIVDYFEEEFRGWKL